MKALALALLLGFGGVNTWSEDLPKVNLSELNCLAKNIYHEARGEPVEGQLAVALVTLNRAETSSVCKVVYQRKQFSWTTRPKKINNKNEWNNSNQIAYQATVDRDKYNFSATHYHADYVKPNWRLKRVTKIGKHIFYK